MFQGIKVESVAENECTCIVGIFSTQHWSLPSYPESSFQGLKKWVKVVRDSWLCETQSGSFRELVEKKYSLDENILQMHGEMYYTCGIFFTF